MLEVQMKDLARGDKFKVTEDDDVTYVFLQYTELRHDKFFTLINEKGKAFMSYINPTVYVFKIEE